MKKVYILKEDENVLTILEETYDDIFAAVKHRKPDAEGLAEDDELFQLHDLLVLLRLGHLKTQYLEGQDGQVFRIFEIDESLGSL